jgi:hypothetical protein
MWGIGFGLDISMQFSSTKDKSVGKLEDLLKRSKAILSSKIQPPDHPPLRKLRKGSSPADFGLTPLAMYEEGREKYTNMITDQVLKVLELDKHYGIKLLYDWNAESLSGFFIISFRRKNFKGSFFPKYFLLKIFQ